MRPQSIIRFEQFYLASAAVGALNDCLNFAGIGGPTELSDAGNIVALVLVALVYGLSFLLWFLITHRASNVAKWILVVLTVLDLLAMVLSVLIFADTDKVDMVLMLLAMVLQCASMVYLFRRDAAEWLRNKDQQEPIDVTTFN